MKISLNSTSFLLPQNKNWEILEKLEQINFNDYGNITKVLIDPENQKNDCDFIIFFLQDIIDHLSLGSLDIDKEINKILNIIELIKKRLDKNKKPIVFALSGFLIENTIKLAKNESNFKKIKNKFLDNLYTISSKYPNLYILDVDEIFAKEGFKNCFDQRNYYLSRCRLSNLGIEILAYNLKKILTRISSSNKKVLILDCDNTLWGGVLGEDGYENILIGQDGIGLAFRDFQKTIKKIKEEGTLIALCSKNNESDVVNVLKNHNSMILKYDDIAALKINWKEKSENIKELAKELGLGIDSFMFWDDNPVEREKVKMQIQDIEVIDPDKDVSKWCLQLAEYEGFSKFQTTEEDKLKTQQYKSRSKFVKEKSNFSNEFEYLKNIKLNPSLMEINESTISRAVQLCQKTNQFNLRTTRYDANLLLNLKKENPNSCFLVKLKDIYGDHGIIALFCLKLLDKNYLFLDTFLMSCRILGRHLEAWILNQIINIAKKKKINFVIAEFKYTKKNNVAKKFLGDHGFKKISNKEFTNINNNFSKISSNGDKSDFYIANIKKIKIPFLEIYK